jgi:hypothetical protein
VGQRGGGGGGGVDANERQGPGEEREQRRGGASGAAAERERGAPRQRRELLLRRGGNLRDGRRWEVGALGGWRRTRGTGREPLTSPAGETSRAQLRSAQAAKAMAAGA